MTGTVVPPLPDVPYLTGIDRDLGPLHAIRHIDAVSTVDRGDTDDSRVQVDTACGGLAVIARRWGGFPRGDDGMDRCPVCAWAVAIGLDDVAGQLRAMTPVGARLEAFNRLLGEPAPAVRLCEAILPDDYDDRDHPRVLQLLAHATSHAPQLLVPEDCGDGSCDHIDDPTTACYEDAWVGCCACSVRAGSWAGEWEGQVSAECAVSAPCGVLTAMAKYYKISPGGRDTRSEVPTR